MKKLILFLISFVTVFSAIGKNTRVETTYWNDSITYEVPKKEAFFKRLTIDYPNGSRRIELVDLKNNSTIVVDAEEFNGEEPCGIWIKEMDGVLTEVDYNFILVYRLSSVIIEDSIPQKNILLFLDEPSINYIAPTIKSGEKNLFDYIRNNMFKHYKDEFCNDTTLMPKKVVLEFTISTKGIIENIAITESANPLYDKEAFRLIRELHIDTPAYFNGRAKEITLRFPILLDRHLLCTMK
jgi:hypothetical protein